MEKYITGDNFTTIVGSVMGVIIAMRSISKISMMIGEKIRPTAPPTTPSNATQLVRQPLDKVASKIQDSLNV